LEHAQALRELAAALMQALQWEEAREVIAQIPDVAQQTQALQDLAKVLIYSGELEKAREVIAQIPDVAQQAQALRDLAAALMRAWQWEEAREVITQIPDVAQQAQALRDLAEVLIQRKELEKAREVWAETREVITQIPDTTQQVQALRELATALIQAREWKMAREVIDSIPKFVDASPTAIHIRLMEDPLTAQNLASMISALTELSTKYWLISKGRFADLIEYTQTHNGRFAEEAHTVVTKISYNSPFNMDWKVDLSAPSVAEALVTTIDGVTQLPKRLEKAKLENQARALEIKAAEQKIEREDQMALIEQEKQRLELEQRRLEVIEKQLEIQKKSIENALELAGKIADTLGLHADAETRTMVVQTFLSDIIQLQNIKGLEGPLPPNAE
jgi:tetratricopeptide (TPR) repeat protein